MKFIELTPLMAHGGTRPNGRARSHRKSSVASEVAEDQVPKPSQSFLMVLKIPKEVRRI